jgi:hypothetical protein
MKRYLPFVIILTALFVAVGAGALFLHFRQSPPTSLAGILLA